MIGVPDRRSVEMRGRVAFAFFVGEPESAGNVAATSKVVGPSMIVTIGVASSAGAEFAGASSGSSEIMRELIARSEGLLPEGVSR